MQAIILAAGLGTRLRPVTNDQPKCILEIDGKTVLSYIIEAFQQNRVKDIAIVTGHKGELIVSFLKDRFQDISFNFYHNERYSETNMLTSLFCAMDSMADGFIFSYSDIIYSPSVVKNLMRSNEDISLVVDVDWKKAYSGRTLHPMEEAELVNAKNYFITQVSKFMNPDTSYGEFIGLGKFTAKGAEILIRNYQRIVKNQWCGYKEHHRFHDAVSFERAYLTDMFQDLIFRGYPIFSVDIRSGWSEIDTYQDLKLSEQRIQSLK